MTLRGLLDVGRDALIAQAYGIAVTGQNISNVNTPGYVRREALLQTHAAGPLGTVEALGIRRIRDQFLDARFYESSGFSGAATARDQALAIIETSFDETDGTGLGSALSNLLQSFSALAANPSDPTSRGAVLARVEDFVSRVHSAAGSLQTLRQDLLSQAQGTAGQVQDLLSQIAALEQQMAQQSALGNETADLRDQEDKLLANLAELTEVHTFTDGSGKLVIQGAGTTLLEGGQASSLSVSTAMDGTLKIEVTHPGGAKTEITQQLHGGALGGIRQARDVDAVAVSSQLDQLVYDVATAINQQHAAGYGLDGISNRNLFTVSSGPGTAATLSMDPQLAGHPERVAAADSAASLPGGAGNAALLADLGAKAIAGGGKRTAMQAYSDLVGDVATRKAAAEQEAELRSSMQAQVRTLRESESGVSMDEEMVSLTKYQRAYEAGLKLIKTADELLAGLMQSLGG